MDWNNQDTAANLSAWFLAPVPQVAPFVGTLQNAPSGIDTVSKAGCKSQLYTSWDSFALSFFIEYSENVPSPKEIEKGVKNIVTANPQMDQPTATTQELSTTQRWEQIPETIRAHGDKTTKTQFMKNELIYHEGTFLTPTEAAMLENLTFPEYTLFMLERIQSDAQRGGVANLGLDQFGLKDAYNLLIHDIRIGLEPRRHARSTKKNSGQNTAPVTTSSTTPAPKVPTQDELDTTLVHDFDLLLNQIHGTGLTDNQLAIIKKRAPTVAQDQPQSDQAPETKPPSLLPYSDTMQKFRAARLREYYTLKPEKRRVPKLSDQRGSLDGDVARMLLKRKKYEITVTGAKNSQWDGPINKQRIELVTRTLRRSERNAGDKALSHVTAPTDTTIPAPPEKKIRDSDATWGVSTIPIRCVFSSTYPGMYEQLQPIPYSVVYKAMEARLIDSTQTGTLGSVVRSPNVRDATSMLSLVKSIRTNPASIMDIAPIMRNALLACSLDPDTAAIDIMPSQLCRNAYRYWSSVHIVRRTKNTMPDGTMFAVPLDVFVTMMSNGTFTQPLPGGFTTASVDTVWTAVPMRSAFCSQRAAAPYLMSFLHSSYSTGSVNWRTKHVYVDPVNGGTFYPDGKTGMIAIPASNSVDIPGPKSAIIVLTDVSSTSTNAATITIAGQVVPIWNGTAAMVGNPVNIAAFWDARYNDDGMADMRQAINQAHNELATRVSTLNTCSLALSMVADIRMAMRPGIAMRTKTDVNGRHYDFAEPMCGAWMVASDDKWPNPCPLYRDGNMMGEWKARGEWDDGADKWIPGFNIAALTSHHLAPSGYAQLLSLDDRDPLPEWDEVWIDTAQIFSAPTYMVTNCSSLTRVAIHTGLIDTSIDALQFRTIGAMPTLP